MTSNGGVGTVTMIVEDLHRWQRRWATEPRKFIEYVLSVVKPPIGFEVMCSGVNGSAVCCHFVLG